MKEAFVITKVKVDTAFASNHRTWLQTLEQEWKVNSGEIKFHGQ